MLHSFITIFTIFCSGGNIINDSDSYASNPEYSSTVTILLKQDYKSKHRFISFYENGNFNCDLKIREEGDYLIYKKNSPGLVKSIDILKVHKTAIIGKNFAWKGSAYIGSDSMLGDNITFGEYNMVESNVKIENEVEMGSYNTIGKSCFLQEKMIVGDGNTFETNCNFGKKPSSMANVGTINSNKTDSEKFRDIIANNWMKSTGYAVKFSSLYRDTKDSINEINSRIEIGSSNFFGQSSLFEEKIKIGDGNKFHESTLVCKGTKIGNLNEFGSDRVVPTLTCCYGYGASEEKIKAFEAFDQKFNNESDTFKVQGDDVEYHVILERNVTIGSNNSFMKKTFIGRETSIGNNNKMNNKTIIENNVIISDGNTFGYFLFLCDNVEVESGTFFGNFIIVTTKKKFNDKENVKPFTIVNVSEN